MVADELLPFFVVFPAMVFVMVVRLFTCSSSKLDKDGAMKTVRRGPSNRWARGC